MSTRAEAFALIVVDRLFPILRDTLVGGQTNVVRARIRDAVDEAIRQTSTEADASATAMRASVEAGMRIEAEHRCAALRTECRQLREADTTSAALAQEQAVASARQDERDKADVRVANANATAEQHCATQRAVDFSVSQQAQGEAVAAARRDEQDKCAKARAADAATARGALNDAVVAARADEQARAAVQRATDAAAADRARNDAVAAARADEQSKCTATRAADAQAAETKRLADVAAARKDERAKCVTEIGVAPVTGITVALTLFATSMRTQIQNYVKAGPYA